jgi:hypothetical protein
VIQVSKNLKIARLLRYNTLVWYPLSMKVNLNRNAPMLEPIHHDEIRQAERLYQVPQGPVRGESRAVPDIAVSGRETENILRPVIVWRHVH